MKKVVIICLLALSSAFSLEIIGNYYTGGVANYRIVDMPNDYLVYSNKVNADFVLNKNSKIALSEYNISAAIVKNYSLESYLVKEGFQIDQNSKDRLEIVYFGERKQFKPFDFGPALGMFLNTAGSYSGKLAESAMGSIKSGQEAGHAGLAGVGFGLLIGAISAISDHVSEDTEYLMISKACNDKNCSNIYSLFTRPKNKEFNRTEIVQACLRSSLDSVSKPTQHKQFDLKQEESRYQQLLKIYGSSYEEEAKSVCSRVQGFKKTPWCDQNRKMYFEIGTEKETIKDNSEVAMVSFTIPMKWYKGNVDLIMMSHIIADYGYKNGYSSFAFASGKLNNISGFPYNSNNIQDYLFDFKLVSTDGFEKIKTDITLTDQERSKQLYKFVNDADKLKFHNTWYFYDSLKYRSTNLYKVSVIFFKNKPLDFITWDIDNIRTTWSKGSAATLFDKYYSLNYYE